jgi:hypothetical protein
MGVSGAEGEQRWSPVVGYTSTMAPRFALVALPWLLGCSPGASPAPAASVEAGAPAPSSPVVSAAPPAALPSASASAPVVAQLAPADAAFVDARRGFSWGDRCSAHYHAGELPSARAACERGLALPDLDPGARPALLYNEGLIAAKAGDVDGARAAYVRSLAARPEGEEGRAIVEKALVALGGSPPPPAPIQSALECRAKCANGTVELFLDWSPSVNLQGTATGWLRTTRTTGVVVTRAVDAELYKGLVLVNPAGVRDPKSRVATEQTSPAQSLQVGDYKQPWLPCDAALTDAAAPSAAAPGRLPPAIPSTSTEPRASVPPASAATATSSAR